MRAIPKKNRTHNPKNVVLKCATWNVKRGIVKRELEITHLLNSENIDIIFLTETDTKQMACETDYTIKAWNRASNDLKNKANIYGAKAAIKFFVKTLPI